MFKIKNWVSDNPKKFKRYLLLLIFSFVIFLSCISADASTLSDKLGDPTDYISDNGYDINDYPYYFIHQRPNGDFRYVFSKKPFVFTDEKTNGFIGNVGIGLSPDPDTDNSIIHVIYSNGSFIKFEHDFLSFALINYTHMCYSNHNIVYNGNAERVFFYASPLTKMDYPLIGGQISTQMIINLMTREILTIVPFLMVLVASLMGLRKVLAILSRLLHKA